MRAILNSNRYEHISDMLETVHQMSLEKRRQYRTCLQVYKGVNNLSTPMINEMFELTNYSTYQTKSVSNRDLRITMTRLLLVDKNIRCRGPKIWNTIEPELKIIDSYEIFKRDVLHIYIFKYRDTKDSSIIKNWA